MKSKKTMLLSEAYNWVERFIEGLSLSLLASGIVAALMAEAKILQAVALMVCSTIGAVIAYLMRIIPLLTEEPEDE